MTKMRRLLLAGILTFVLSPMAVAAPTKAATPATNTEVSARSTRSRKDIVQIGRLVTLAEGETAESIVVIGAPAEIHGTVEDDVVVIGGSSHIAGTVEGDAVAVGGSLRLGPKAVIGGDAVSVGGRVEAEPGSSIGGDNTSVNIAFGMPQFAGLKEWIVSGLMMGRPLPHRATWAWLLALAMVLVYILVAAAFPNVIGRCAQTLEIRPATALGVGLLGCAMAVPVGLLLTLSLIGIAAVPLAVCAGLAGVIVGKAGVYRLAGAKIGSPLGWDSPNHAPLAVALGGAAFTVLHAIPVVGFVTWGFAAALGFGAALLVLVDSFRGETAKGQTGTAAAPPAAETAVSEVAATVNWGKLPRAGFWERLGAVAIDGLIFIVLAGILPLVTTNLAAWAVFQIGLWTWKGTTIGGIVFGLRGVRLDGSRMNFGVAVVRHLASYLSAMAGFLGFLWAAWDPEQQTWHDKIAGTIVVRAPKSEPLI